MRSVKQATSESIQCFLSILLLSFLLVICSSSKALSQFSDFDVTNTLPPTGVTRYGSLEVTWVRSQLDNGKLFQIASPTVVNRSDPQVNQVPVEVRAKNIEDLIRLEIGKYRQKAIAEIIGSDDGGVQGNSPRSVKVIISKLKNLPVLQIADPATSRPFTIATVTSIDANFYSKTPNEIAQQWKSELEREISRAADIYSSGQYLQRLQRTVLIPLGLTIWTALLVFFRVLVQKRLKSLLDQYERELRSSSKNAAEIRADSNLVTNKDNKAEISFLEIDNILKEQFSLGKQIDVYRSTRLILLWVIILSWYFGAYIVTTQLPILLVYSKSFLTQPLNILVIWFFVTILVQISHALIRRSVSAWKDNPHPVFGDVKRQLLRSRTIAGVLRSLVMDILILIGIILSLAQLGLSASSILTGSVLFGLAITFGAQNLVKDLVNGCLILMEDQFAVGDIVTINGETGLVEQLYLRITQLRNIDGELISIPNSSITMVKNKTSSWSRVNLGLEVAYSTDLDHAITVINEVAMQISQDPKWQEFILEPPEVLGVDAFGENSITIRLWIRTEPGQHFPIGREFRKRIKLAFDEAGISIPFPQRSIWVETDLGKLQSNS